MKDFCVLSDFDGTITTKDGLYTFIENFAEGDWQKIEQEWADGKISSKECLIEEFKLVPNLTENLIDNFVKTLTIDEYFPKFYENLLKINVDFYIVSDGIDYFIKRILKRHGLTNMQIISNHGEFNKGNFELTFPNDNMNCKNNAGTCKCSVLHRLKDTYNKIYYIGDGVSDYCVADKADVLFAKKRLAEFCNKNGINYIKYESFNDITDTGIFR